MNGFENLKLCTFILAQLIEPDKELIIPDGHIYEWADKIRSSMMCGFDDFMVFEDTILEETLYKTPKK